jgi:histone H3/H4
MPRVKEPPMPRGKGAAIKARKSPKAPRKGLVKPAAAVESGTGKTRRRRNQTATFVKEAAKLAAQSSTKPAFPKQAMMRLVREIAQDLNTSFSVRFKPAALEALQCAAEDMVDDLMKASTEVMSAGGSQTLMSKHLITALSLMSTGNTHMKPLLREAMKVESEALPPKKRTAFIVNGEYMPAASFVDPRTMLKAGKLSKKATKAYKHLGRVVVGETEARLGVVEPDTSCA